MARNLAHRPPLGGLAPDPPTPPPNGGSAKLRRNVVAGRGMKCRQRRKAVGLSPAWASAFCAAIAGGGVAGGAATASGVAASSGAKGPRRISQSTAIATAAREFTAVVRWTREDLPRGGS